MVNMHFHVDIEQKDVLIEPMLLVPICGECVQTRRWIDSRADYYYHS